jgi:hypothetical protein
MTQKQTPGPLLDEAKKVVPLQGQVVGLWLAARHLPCMSPGMGQWLMGVARQCEEKLRDETNPTLLGDVSQFIQGVYLLCNAGLIQEAAILDELAEHIGHHQVPEGGSP